MNMDIRSQGRSHWLNNKAKSSVKPAERRAAQHDNQGEPDAFWSSVNLKEGSDSEPVVISSIYNSLPRACCIFIWISIHAATRKHNSGAPIKEATSLSFGTLEEPGCVPFALEVRILQGRWRWSWQCVWAAWVGLALSLTSVAHVTTGIAIAIAQVGKLWRAKLNSDFGFIKTPQAF